MTFKSHIKKLFLAAALPAMLPVAMAAGKIQVMHAELVSPAPELNVQDSAVKKMQSVKLNPLEVQITELAKSDPESPVNIDEINKVLNGESYLDSTTEQLQKNIRGTQASGAFLAGNSKMTDSIRVDVNSIQKQCSDSSVSSGKVLFNLFTVKNVKDAYFASIDSAIDAITKADQLRESFGKTPNYEQSQAKIQKLESEKAFIEAAIADYTSSVNQAAYFGDSGLKNLPQAQSDDEILAQIIVSKKQLAKNTARAVIDGLTRYYEISAKRKAEYEKAQADVKAKQEAEDEKAEVSAVKTTDAKKTDAKPAEESKKDNTAEAKKTVLTKTKYAFGIIPWGSTELTPEEIAEKKLKENAATEAKAIKERAEADAEALRKKAEQLTEEAKKKAIEDSIQAKIIAKQRAANKAKFVKASEVLSWLMRGANSTDKLLKTASLSADELNANKANALKIVLDMVAETTADPTVRNFNPEQAVKDFLASSKYGLSISDFLEPNKDDKAAK